MMFAAAKYNVTHFFYPSELQRAIQQNKADKAIALITHVGIPLNTFYGDFTLTRVSRCLLLR